MLQHLIDSNVELHIRSLNCVNRFWSVRPRFVCERAYVCVYVKMRCSLDEIESERVYNAIHREQSNRVQNMGKRAGKRVDLQSLKWCERDTQWEKHSAWDGKCVPYCFSSINCAHTTRFHAYVHSIHSQSEYTRSVYNTRTIRLDIEKENKSSTHQLENYAKK